MRKLSCLLVMLMALGLGACKSEGPDAGQLAAVAAKGYYDLLKEGKYEQFVTGMNQPYRIPKGYHDQLVLNTQMFCEQMAAERRGLADVSVINAKADTARHIADVFLLLSYGDSTKEQVVVPMVEVQGRWKMR